MSPPPDRRLPPRYSSQLIWRCNSATYLSFAVSLLGVVKVRNSLSAKRLRRAAASQVEQYPGEGCCTNGWGEQRDTRLPLAGSVVLLVRSPGRGVFSCQGATRLRRIANAMRAVCITVHVYLYQNDVADSRERFGHEEQRVPIRFLRSTRNTEICDCPLGRPPISVSPPAPTTKFSASPAPSPTSTAANRSARTICTRRLITGRWIGICGPNEPRPQKMSSPLLIFL